MLERVSLRQIGACPRRAWSGRAAVLVTTMVATLVPLVALGVTPAGAVGSGSHTNAARLAPINADVWQNAGLTGAGVKIGIIDSFFGSTADWDTAAASLELPTRAQLGGTFCQFNGAPGCSIYNDDPNAVHGRGVAEIVHDVAPGATLYLAVALRRDDVQAALDYFAAQGVKVVSRSGWSPYDGPGDGTGPTASMVDNAVAQGMLVVHSAGNVNGAPTTAGFAGSHFRQVWSDTDNDGWMNFADGAETLSVGCSTWTGLRWSDWGEANPSDYDLYVSNAAAPAEQWNAYTATQDDAADPMVEGDVNFPYGFCANHVGTALVKIQRKTAGADANDTLEFATNGSEIKSTATSSVVAYDNTQSASMGIVDSKSPGEISVGALNTDPLNGSLDSVALGSAHGPTVDGRIKPDLVARACYQTQANAADPASCFTNTSGAAPVVAGEAALAIAAGVASDPTTVRRFLIGNATDREAAGPDNVAGYGEARLPATPPAQPAQVPGAPTALSATPGAGSIALSWTAPASTGGLPLSGYLAVVKQSASGVVVRADDLGVVTTTTLSGLANGSYKVELWPRTSRGFGAKATSATVLLGSTVPGAPTSPTATGGVASATVSWVAPASNGGSPITGYTATSSPGAQTCTTAGALTCVVSGLTNETSYTFTVKATNANGAGAASVASNAVTPHAAPVTPNPPTMTGVSVTSSTVTVTWTAPASGPFTGFRATAHNSGENPNVVDPVAFSTVGAAARTTTITGLAPGHLYRIRVQTLNDTAASTYSAGMDATTTAGPSAPGAPTGVIATPSDSSAHVSWSPPASDGGSQIVLYQATAAPGGASCVIAGLSCPITGLTNNTTYTVTVTAANGIAVGPPSVGVPVTPVAATPNPPTITNTTSTSTSVSVTFTAPGSGPFTGFRATAHNSGEDPNVVAPQASATVGSTARTATITGLTPGHPYRIRVQTLNGPASSTYSPGVDVTPPVPTSVPGAPQNPMAVAKLSAALVSWTAPTSDGGSSITGYVVTSTPGNKGCATTAALSCTVPDLTAGTSYTFTIRAINAIGTGAASAATAAVTPWDGSGYHPMPPVRVLDSRGSVGGWGVKLSAGTPKSLKVTGADVPTSARAVVLNVTVTNGTAGSFLTVYPAGTTLPTASNLNFAAGQTLPNLVTVKVGTGGMVSFANAVGAVDVIADLVGYYDDGSAADGQLFNGITPGRALDSRTTNGGWGGTPLGTATRDVTIRGRVGVPGTATAAVINITATGGTNGSFLTAWPAGVTKPNASNVNFAAGQTIPNLAIVQLGTGGAISITNAIGTVDVVLDVVGYFDPASGSRFHPLNPARVLDDRNGTGGLSGPWGPNQTRALQLAGTNGIPTQATGVAINTTVTNGTAGSLLTVFPAPGSAPQASNLNFGPGQTIANLVIVKVGAGGGIGIFNAAGSVDVIADAVGYYAPF